MAHRYNMNREACAIGIVINSIIILLIYLFSIRWHIYLPITFFWLAVVLILGTISYQSYQCKLLPAYAKIVVLEIAATCVVFHLIYQIPYYGLYGADSYWDLVSAKGIMETGFLLSDPEYLNVTSFFPIIHIIGATFSLISGIGIFHVAKWFPSLLGFVTILLLYLTTRDIFRNETIALLSILLFSCLQHYILFGSLFVRETIAIALMMCSIYLLFSNRYSSHAEIYRTLSIIFLMLVVLAHHLTSFMLLLFLLVQFMVNKVNDHHFSNFICFDNEVFGEKIGISFILLAISLVLAYWTYVIFSPLYSLITFFLSLFGREPQASFLQTANIDPAEILTLRGFIIFYGFHIFILIFGIILFYQILQKSRKKRVEMYSFTIFLYICGILGLFGLYLSNIPAFPDRMLIYGWIMGFPPLVMGILNTRRKTLLIIGQALLFSFMLFNIYMITPASWDTGSRDIAAAPSEQEYALAHTFDFSNQTIIAYSNTLLAIFDLYNVEGIDIHLLTKIRQINFTNFIISKKIYADEMEPPPLITDLHYNAKMVEAIKYYNSRGYKIYDSNEVSLFRTRKV